MTIESEALDPYYEDGHNGNDHSLILVIIAELAVISANLALIRRLDFGHIPVSTCRNAWRWRHRASLIFENAKAFRFFDPFNRRLMPPLSLFHYAAVYCPAPALQVLIDAEAEFLLKQLPLHFRPRWAYERLKEVWENPVQSSGITPVDCAVATLRLDAVRWLITYYPVMDVVEEKLCLWDKGWYGYFAPTSTGGWRVVKRITGTNSELCR